MVDESSNTHNVQARMSSKIRHLVDQSIHFQLLLSEDGSGRGAGLAAAVAAAAQ